MLKQTLNHNGKAQPRLSSVQLSSVHHELSTKIVDVGIAKVYVKPLSQSLAEVIKSLFLPISGKYWHEMTTE